MVAKGNAVMPTDLIATTPGLSSCAQQLRVAAQPAAQSRRSGNFGGTLRIEIAVAVEVVASDSDVRLAGSFALRVSSG